MPSVDFPADAFDGRVTAEVAELLATTWDPNGRIIRQAVSRRDEDSSEPRSYADYATVLCGITAAGGSQGAVMGYLRHEEVELLGTSVTTGKERGAVARGLWKAVGRRTRREMLHGSGDAESSVGEGPWE
jgi:hypothetical protein